MHDASHLKVTLYYDLLRSLRQHPNAFMEPNFHALIWKRSLCKVAVYWTQPFFKNEEAHHTRRKFSMKLLRSQSAYLQVYVLVSWYPTEHMSRLLYTALLIASCIFRANRVMRSPPRLSVNFAGFSFCFMFSPRTLVYQNYHYAFSWNHLNADFQLKSFKLSRFYCLCEIWECTSSWALQYVRKWTSWIWLFL